MIDFERAQLLRRNPFEARRFRLAKIHREIGAAATAASCWRFLRVYARGDRGAARRWWRAVEAHAPRLARRDFERMARNAVSEGRRFGRLAGSASGWSGWVQGEGPKPGLLAELERALEALAEPAEPIALALEDLWCVVAAAAKPRDEALVWATAQLLHARGLAPVPRAWLRRGGRAVLVLERGAARPLGPDERSRAAARVLFRRLLALGRWRGGAGSGAVAVEPGRGGALRALLLAPHGLELGGRADPRGRAHADRVADQVAARALAESPA
jgi:hypothetical protein